MLNYFLIVLLVLIILFVVFQIALTWYGVKLIEENNEESVVVVTSEESPRMVVKRRWRLLIQTVSLFVIAILAALGIKWALKRRNQMREKGGR